MLQRAEHCAGAGVRREYLVEFDVIALFGSVLGGRAEDIGDVDVLWKMQWIPELRLDDSASIGQLCLDLFDKDGRSSSQVMDYMTWPGVKLLRALRNRNTYLSLHSWIQADILDDEAEVMVIYQWPYGRVPDPRAMPAKEFVALQRERDEAREPLPAAPTKRRRR
jgi:hypothetical protein